MADIPLSPTLPTWQLLEQIQRGLEQCEPLPIKLIWGMRDWCFRPECLHRFQQMWPHAETCEIAGAGHYVVEDATDQVIREVEDFLNRDEAL